ncbi:MAG: TylF/MycF family methyltransferase [Syntrophales bacterium LBB04]|nr:TylF/MycF family methyltransferase [Syntrophales bacterium LBB04]
MRNLIEKVGDRVGWAVFDSKSDYHYCPNTYGMNFWKKIDIRDLPDFGPLAQKVIADKKTYLFYDRLYPIYQALANTGKLTLVPPSIAEVGVYRGGGTYFIASVAKRLFATQPKIHSFDTFAGHPDDIRPELDGEHRSGQFHETSLDEVQAYLAGFPNIIFHKGRFQDRCADVVGEGFGFVHLDVDIYSATSAALAFFADALLVGGIIIVDDYGVVTCQGVQQAVDEFAAGRANFCKFHLDTGQGLMVRLS